MRIKDRTVGENEPVYVIAEAGVNHNGRLDTAFKLIDVAKESGADAVKFQSFSTSDLVAKGVTKAPYQQATVPEFEDQYEMLLELEINESFHKSIVEYCRDKDLTFLSTPYDSSNLRLLLELNVPVIKIASTDTTNLLFLEEIGRTGLPVILSTGMCSVEEVSRAYQTLQRNGCEEIALLKCTSNYPTALDEVNLFGISELEGLFNTTVGFSDHTAGIGAAPYAVACGAKIIEKHFTLDKKMKGPDHRASLSPPELTELVKEIRLVERMLGQGKITPTKSERSTKRSLQKYFVCREQIKMGSEFSRENIIPKRTGGIGISAIELYDLLGKTARRDLELDQVVLREDVLEYRDE